MAAQIWPAAAAQADTAANVGTGARSPRGGSGADHPPPTRLVTGLPALQDLLGATLADSLQRHVNALPPDSGLHRPGADRPPESAPVGPASAEVSGALPAAWGARSMSAVPGLLPGLDALGEEMLVDHLADRLAERLRDQALRQHGFTGGWL